MPTFELIAYEAAAKRIREGDDSPEAWAAVQAAETAYRATVPVVIPSRSGWWNLPIAATMWPADVLDSER